MVARIRTTHRVTPAGNRANTRRNSAKLACRSNTNPYHPSAYHLLSLLHVKQRLLSSPEFAPATDAPWAESRSRLMIFIVTIPARGGRDPVCRTCRKRQNIESKKSAIKLAKEISGKTVAIKPKVEEKKVDAVPVEGRVCVRFDCEKAGVVQPQVNFSFFRKRTPMIRYVRRAEKGSCPMASKKRGMTAG